MQNQRLERLIGAAGASQQNSCSYLIDLKKMSQPQTQVVMVERCLLARGNMSQHCVCCSHALSIMGNKVSLSHRVSVFIFKGLDYVRSVQQDLLPCLERADATRQPRPSLSVPLHPSVSSPAASWLHNRCQGNEDRASISLLPLKTRL